MIKFRFGNPRIRELRRRKWQYEELKIWPARGWLAGLIRTLSVDQASSSYGLRRRDDPPAAYFVSSLRQLVLH